MTAGSQTVVNSVRPLKMGGEIGEKIGENQEKIEAKKDSFFNNYIEMQPKKVKILQSLKHHESRLFMMC